MLDLREIARTIASGTLGGGLAVAVKTNYGPEIELYRTRDDDSAPPGTGGGGLLSRALGVKAALIVRDAHGRQLAEVGAVPATDPLRVLALVALLAGLGWIIWRGIRP